MSEYLKRSARIAVVLLAGLAVAGCGRPFATTYATPAPAAARSDWRVTDVRIVTPVGITTTEENSFMPAADLVWHGDPPGNRAEQITAIVKQGVERGFAGLKGGQDVVATITLRRFHSLTPKAYFSAPAGTGVHSVAFDVTITDRKTGAILAGPERIKADMPAAVAAAGGKSLSALPADIWKKQISDHIAATIRSWNGAGPDIRNGFIRMGA